MRRATPSSRVANHIHPPHRTGAGMSPARRRRSAAPLQRRRADPSRCKATHPIQGLAAAWTSVSASAWACPPHGQLPRRAQSTADRPICQAVPTDEMPFFLSCTEHGTTGSAVAGGGRGVDAGLIARGILRFQISDLRFPVARGAGWGGRRQAFREWGGFYSYSGVGWAGRDVQVLGVKEFRKSYFSGAVRVGRGGSCATLFSISLPTFRISGRGGYEGCCLCWILAQVSLSVTVRLKTSRSGVESGSTQK